MDNKIVIRMDIRGFVRFSEADAKEFKLDKNCYADIEVDRVGKRIAITPTKTLKPTSFRFMANGSGYLIYLKGALNATGYTIVPGPYFWTKEGSKVVFAGKNPSKKKGEWEILPCRNSVGIPMLSIDSRGTIIFDKRTSTAVESAKNPTMIAEYDASKKTFKLTFGKKGFINVRTIASHANASFMGTLSSHGIALPKKSFRTACNIDGKVVTFSIAPIVAEQKASAKEAKAKKSK